MKLITMHPENEGWWPSFRRRWGRKALTACCNNCRHFVEDRVEGMWCLYWGERLGWVSETVCPCWEPKGDG